jgi:hypothetical protein
MDREITRNEDASSRCIENRLAMFLTRDKEKIIWEYKVYSILVSAFLEIRAPSTPTHHLVDDCRSAINIPPLHQDMSVYNPHRV